MSLSEYGESHKRAKQIKRDQDGGLRCQVTNEVKNIEAHHNTNRLFNGGNHPSNYINLVRWLHQHLHEAANIRDPQLVRQRVELTRSLLHNLHSEDFDIIHARIRELDSHMINLYVENMMNNLSHKFREKILYTTIVTGMNSTRDLSIENHKLKDIIRILHDQVMGVAEILENLHYDQL